METPEELAAIQAQAESTSLTAAEAAAGETKAPSLQETVSAIVEEHSDTDGDQARREDESEKSPTSESDAERKDPQELEQEQATEQQEEPVPKPLTAEEKEALEVSFQQSERFQEMQKTVTESTPYVQWAKDDLAFMQKHQISQEDWKSSRDLLALSKTNPDEFWSKIDALREQYDVIKGKRLPGDLQDAVEKQEISLEMAKKFALQRVQNQTMEQNQQLLQQRQAQEWQNTIKSTADEWDAQKAKSDPDFRPKKTQTEPDGKYELVVSLALQMAQAQAPRSATDVRNLLDAAYNKVNDYQKRFTPRTRAARRDLTNGSSLPALANAEPKSLQEAVNASVGKKHGIKIGAQ